MLGREILLVQAEVRKPFFHDTVESLNEPIWSGMLTDLQFSVEILPFQSGILIDVVQRKMSKETEELIHRVERERARVACECDDSSSDRMYEVLDKRIIIP